MSAGSAAQDDRHCPGRPVGYPRGVSQPLVPYVVDPADPRAPPAEVWVRLTAAERAQVVASLPSEFPVEAFPPPEGDPHFNAKVGARSALGAYFERIGRRVYLACELPVYYPGEKMFAPDVMAVVDVERHERMSWVVSHEERGLDLALEIHVAGDRRKDLERNVERYARLGITEYFIFDRGRLGLAGYRLPEVGARSYQRVVPQVGRLASAVLGLDLAVEGERLRFFHGTAPVPEAEEIIARLDGMVEGLEARAAAAEARAEEESRLHEEESRLREEESRKREQAERKLGELEAELRRLRGEVER